MISRRVRDRLAAMGGLRMVRPTGFAKLSLCLVALVPLAGPAAAVADYPTDAVVDYVLGCMRSNGQTRETLERCSCSIDVIASIIPYERYESAETFRRMALTTGEASGLFRETAPARAAGSDLKRAQAEADIRCF
jgi:hypothetical protein